MHSSLIFLAVDGHTVACLVGILLSVYALYVEIRKHRDPKYIAACDLGENMQCSRVLTSQYSRGFGLTKYLFGEHQFLNVPNCVTGLIFYILQIVLAHLSGFWAKQVLFYSNVLSCIGCAYLAYILAFVLRDLCIVCISTYLVNGYLLYVTYGNLQSATG